MKRVAALILGILILGSFAVAQQATADNPDPATREQIVKMMDIMNVRNQVKVMMDTVRQQVGTTLDQQFEKSDTKLPPEMRAEMTAAMQDMMKDMEPLMSDMMDQMVPIYQKHLSRTEADAIIAFYLSPEGQSFLKKLPLIMQDAMPQMMKSINAKMQPITDKLTKRMEEIRKKYQSQMEGASTSNKTTPAKPAAKAPANTSKKNAAAAK